MDSNGDSQRGPFDAVRCSQIITLIHTQRSAGCCPVLMCGLKCTECSRAMMEAACQRPEWQWV